MKLATHIRRAVVLMIGLLMPLEAVAIAWALLGPGEHIDRLTIVVAAIGVLNSEAALLTDPPGWRQAVRHSITRRFRRGLHVVPPPLPRQTYPLPPASDRLEEGPRE